MSKKVVGTCSLCSGPVEVPAIWHGVNPPEKKCAKCGAVAADHGPVIKMRPMNKEGLRPGQKLLKDQVHDKSKGVLLG